MGQLRDHTNVSGSNPRHRDDGLPHRLAKLSESLLLTQLDGDRVTVSGEGSAQDFEEAHLAECVDSRLEDPGTEFSSGIALDLDIVALGIESPVHALARRREVSDNCVENEGSSLLLRSRTTHDRN